MNNISPMHSYYIGAKHFCVRLKEDISKGDLTEIASTKRHKPQHLQMNNKPLFGRQLIVVLTVLSVFVLDK